MNTQIQPSNLIGNINLGQRNSSAWSVHRELGHQHGPAQPYDNIRRRGTIPPYGSAKIQPCWQYQLSHPKRPAFDGSAKAQI